jgi:hypothetical protein
VSRIALPMIPKEFISYRKKCTSVKQDTRGAGSLFMYALDSSCI